MGLIFSYNKNLKEKTVLDENINICNESIVEEEIEASMNIIEEKQPLIVSGIINSNLDIIEEIQALKLVIKRGEYSVHISEEEIQLLEKVSGETCRVKLNVIQENITLEEVCETIKQPQNIIEETKPLTFIESNKSTENDNKDIFKIDKKNNKKNDYKNK
jgi:hypothetical protein